MFVNRCNSLHKHFNYFKGTVIIPFQNTPSNALIILIINTISKSPIQVEISIVSRFNSLESKKSINWHTLLQWRCLPYMSFVNIASFIFCWCHILNTKQIHKGINRVCLLDCNEVLKFYAPNWSHGAKKNPSNTRLKRIK